MRAEAQGKLRLIAAELDQPWVDLERDVDVRPQLAKPVEPRHQPHGCKRRLDTDADHGLRRCRHQFSKQGIDGVETSDKLLQQTPPGVGQFDTAMVTFEQGLAQEGFEFPDLPADRRLRDEKLLGGPAEAQMPARRLEAPQCRQRQAPTLHFA